ncbi:hypothetical protein [Neoroseomonas soli]|uniref:Uncharacterized protein n=1 Tax=Neoroseomonas soli TaxID=1081025 RepID=A0A9X9WST1_9PROT|nr:hypothetical protein [Neoroseomonas soli]MBR0670210.1 hypothetical protein [Neoroseomonas soli]
MADARGSEPNQAEGVAPAKSGPVMVDAAAWGAGDEAALRDDLAVRRSKLLVPMGLAGLFALFGPMAGCGQLARGDWLEGLGTLALSAVAIPAFFWFRSGRERLKEERSKPDPMPPAA